MIIKDDLHQLIHSMSRMEKRYFKVQAKKGGDEKSNYIRLFDAINGQAEYNEEKIKKKFRKEKFAQNLHKEKPYLYRKILQSLRAYRTEKSADARIKDMLIDVAYLQERSLYKQAHTVIKRAKKLAYEYEKFSMLLEILENEKKILYKIQGKNSAKQILTCLKERKNILNIVQNENNYMELDSQIFSFLLNKLTLKTPTEIERLHQSINAELLKAADKPISFKAKNCFYSANTYYNMLLGNAQQSFDYAKKNIALWENAPRQIEENVYGYRLLLSNFLYSCFTTEQYDEFPDTLEKIKNIPVKNKLDEAVAFYHFYYNQLLYYMNMVEFERGITLVPKIEEGLLRYSTTIKLTTRLTFYSNIGTLYFLAGDYKKALDWFNKIINIKRTNIRLDLQGRAKLLLLVIHYELGNDELLDDVYRSTQRFLSKRAVKHKFESIVLQYFKKIYTAIHRKTLIQIYQEFREKLAMLEQDEHEKKVDCLEEVILWVESKLQKVAIQQLMQNKRHQKSDA